MRLYKLITLVLTGVLFSSSILWSNSNSKMKTVNQNEAVAYFSGGCFWCVEAVYESVKGVNEAISGYAGGTDIDPTYELVGRGQSDHAETVEVRYNPSVISFAELVEIFFGSHDPTTLNRQGPDTGTQYRSIAFYSNQEEKNIIDTYIEQLTKEATYERPIVTEVKPIGVFYKAEEYHQDFESNNPYSPYIINVSKPRFDRFKKNYSKYIKGDHNE